MPERVQLSRRKGWRMPPNTVKVDRSTEWGNPYQCGAELDGHRDHKILSDLYRSHVERPDMVDFRASIRSKLKGKNLACWCPPGEHCHADVLLIIANSDNDRDAQLGFYRRYLAELQAVRDQTSRKIERQLMKILVLRREIARG